jgi:hypothetical protein
VTDDTQPKHRAEDGSDIIVGRRRLLVTGSRDWPLEPVIAGAILREWLDWGKPPLTLVHGDASGADRMAAAVVSKQAEHSDLFKVEAHPAHWDLHGKAAGHIRNAEMVSLGADLCLAFILNDSRGASGCVELAERAGIPVVVYRIDDPRLRRR